MLDGTHIHDCSRLRDPDAMRAQTGRGLAAEATYGLLAHGVGNLVGQGAQVLAARQQHDGAFLVCGQLGCELGIYVLWISMIKSCRIDA